jgi:Flp pilus assembly protein TadB
MGQQLWAGSAGLGANLAVTKRRQHLHKPEQALIYNRPISNREQTMNSARHNPQFRPGTPAGPLARLAAFVLSAAFMVLAFMFSLVALAVVAVVGVALGGWLWWKTRTLRKQMQQMREAQPVSNDQPARSDQVIEGEFIREVPPDQRLR